jgi:hypothetical protein
MMVSENQYSFRLDFRKFPSRKAFFGNVIECGRRGVCNLVDVHEDPFAQYS